MIIGGDFNMIRNFNWIFQVKGVLEVASLI